MLLQTIHVPFTIGDIVKINHAGHENITGTVVQINILSKKYMTFLVEVFDGTEIKMYTMADWQLSVAD